MLMLVKDKLNPYIVMEFFPSSNLKRVSVKALEAALQIGTGLAIWRP